VRVMALAKECLWPASKPTPSSRVVSVISVPLEEEKEDEEKDDARLNEVDSLSREHLSGKCAE
jgi:hypothetical protein